MFINLTVELNEKQCDIRIDSEQKIGEGLAILQEKGKLPKNYSPYYFRSKLNRRLVSAYKSFASEQIFDGDVLICVN